MKEEGDIMGYERVTWWTMKEEGDIMGYERVTWWTMKEEGDMVGYEGEGDTDFFSLQSLKKNILSIVHKSWCSQHK